MLTPSLSIPHTHTPPLSLYISSHPKAALAEVATHRRKAREAALVLEQLNEANAQNARLERETMALRRQLESQIPSPVSTPGAAEATRRIRALERENQTLKSAVQNGHQLMSDLETTKKQLERSDARLQSSIQNEAELGELRDAERDQA